MANTDPVDFSNDILQPLQDADILRYRDICAKRLPMALSAHHILTLRHRWGKILSQPENETLAKSVSPKCITKFYAPRNRNIDKCTFLAIAGESPTDPENSRYSIFLFTLQFPPTELISCLRDSARINWHSGPIFEAFSDDLLPIVEILLAQKGMNDYVNWAVTAQTVMLPKENALAMDIKYGEFDLRNSIVFLFVFFHSVPDDVFFDDLKEHHATTINEEWIHRDSTSYNYIRSLILLNGGLGIFEKSTKRLLSWITVNDYFAFG